MVSSGVPGAELTLRMHQVYHIYVVLLQRHQDATRMLRQSMGGRGEQEAQGATLASRRKGVASGENRFSADVPQVEVLDISKIHDYILNSYQ